jgi:hypothetical protein
MIFTIYEATCEPTYQQRQKPVTLRKNVRKHNANLIQAGRPHVRDLISRDCPGEPRELHSSSILFFGAMQRSICPVRFAVSFVGEENHIAMLGFTHIHLLRASHSCPQLRF